MEQANTAVPFCVYPVLVVDKELAATYATSVGGQAIRRIVENLRALGNTVIEAITVADGMVELSINPNVGCVVLSWDSDYGTLPNELQQEPRFRSFAQANGPLPNEMLIRQARRISAKLPVMICTGKVLMEEIPTQVIAETDGYIWKFEDTSDFIAGRIDAAVRRYTQTVLPPFFAAMVNFAQTYEYSWHTPGHAGGTAFLKAPAGKAFHHFIGENMLRSDLSISVDQLGSLNDHTGPVKDAESLAAEVFGADMTFFVTNGSSTSNRIILQASLTRDDAILVDRNCHKSIQHGIIITGVAKENLRFLWPEHNWLGILGPIAPDNMKIPNDIAAPHIVVTNSTYDGVCYNVSGVLEGVSEKVVRVHFDEAWYAYARFNPMYQGRYGMTDDRLQTTTDSGNSDSTANTISASAPTVVVTHSTHKLLAALSQASMIHIKNRQKGAFDFERFNESFMMHSSTSPQYEIIASTDISTAMMSGEGGERLTQDCIEEAVSFRKTMLKVGRDFLESPVQSRMSAQASTQKWWFRLWQPPEIETEDRTKITHDPNYWLLKSNAEWHGFSNLNRDDWAMLDPIKVTILTPGAVTQSNGGGQWEDMGIPAPIVSSFLSGHGIVVEKTGDYSMLFLFSMGVTKGKSGSLINALCEFKRLYDENASLSEVLPDLVNSYPELYGPTSTLTAELSNPDPTQKKGTIQWLCQTMHAWKRNHQWLETMKKSFEEHPDQLMSPANAYQCLVKDKVEQLKLAQLANRTLAVGVVPYPPGIPMLLPGEATHGDILTYLNLLEAFDKTFLGFSHDIHGVSRDAAGNYLIYCCK